MLETVFGNKTAQLIFLRLYREDEISAGHLAKDFGKSITGFQNQLEKFEDAGLLVSRKIGQVRLFSFNPQSSFVGPLKNLIKIEYEKLVPKVKTVLQIPKSMEADPMNNRRGMRVFII